jgi:type III pantothenate kinase
MLLAIDIGNTNTVIGCFRGDELLGSFRIQSRRAYTTDEAGILCKQLLDHHIKSAEPVHQVVLCSVVPVLTAVYENMSRLYFGCEAVALSSASALGFEIAVREPAQVGADRLANALAALHFHGAPCVVVDFGTATTFDVLDAKRTYRGGVILPGVVTSSAELARRAAQLFRVRIEKPRRVIGNDTRSALQSGIYFGTVGQVEHILAGIRTELGVEPRVIATGGLAELWGGGITGIHEVDVHLTLKGLNLFAHRLVAG